MSHRTSKNVQSTWQAFHDDERGESSALSNIMLIAIAALVIVAVLTFATDFWSRVSEWIDTNVFGEGKAGGGTDG
jgi:hypothetical protein